MRVVYVDDDADLSDIAQLALTSLGHYCKACLNGVDALLIIDSFDPDIVILDIQLPETSGYRIAKSLRKQRTRAFLVAVTGFTSPADRHAAFEAGFHHFVPKPVDLVAIRKIVELGTAHHQPR